MDRPASRGNVGGGVEGASGRDVGFGREVDSSALAEEERGSSEVVSTVVVLGDLPMAAGVGRIRRVDVEVEGSEGG